MKNIVRRASFVALPVVAALGLGGSFLLRVHASAARPVAAGSADTPVAGGGTMGAARAIPFDQQATWTTANGGESRDIAHGTLATGEAVNLHQSMQVVGAAPNPAHVIQHSEFILVREGELEFQHEVAGQMVSERAGPGGVFYVAFGTKHAVKNVGPVPARYFVIQIGGDTK